MNVLASSTSDGVAISVVDEGMGLPDGMDVFEPFKRGHKDLVGATPGIGLGLHIVRNLAEAMGGTVTAETNHWRGSTFTVRLPHREDPSTYAFGSRHRLEHDRVRAHLPSSESGGDSPGRRSAASRAAGARSTLTPAAARPPTPARHEGDQEHHDQEDDQVHCGSLLSVETCGLARWPSPKTANSRPALLDGDRSVS